MKKQTEIDFFKKSIPIENSKKVTNAIPYNPFYVGALYGLVITGFSGAMAASLGVDNIATDGIRFVGTVASSIAFLSYVKKPKHTTTAMLVLGGIAISALAPIALVSHIGTTLGSMGFTSIIRNFLERKKAL